MTNRKKALRGRPRGVTRPTMAFSLPKAIAQEIERRAKTRWDGSKSAVVADALASQFGIVPNEGGDSENEQVPV